MKKDKKTPSANHNWITEETLSKYRKDAKKLSEIHKQFESEHQFEAIKIDNKTVKLKLIK